MDEKLFELDAGELLAAAIVELKTASRRAGFGPNIERTRGILKLLECRIREFEAKHRCPECGNLKNGHSCLHCDELDIDGDMPSDCAEGDWYVIPDDEEDCIEGCRECIRREVSEMKAHAQ